MAMGYKHPCFSWPIPNTPSSFSDNRRGYYIEKITHMSRSGEMRLAYHSKNDHLRLHDAPKGSHFYNKSPPALQRRKFKCGPSRKYKCWGISRRCTKSSLLTTLVYKLVFGLCRCYDTNQHTSTEHYNAPYLIRGIKLYAIQGFDRFLNDLLDRAIWISHALICAVYLNDQKLPYRG